MEFIDTELQIKVTFPDDWKVLDNKDIFVDHLDMSIEEASSTDFLLVRDAEKAEDIRYLTFASDEGRYPTESEYNVGLEANISFVREHGGEVIARDTTTSDNGLRLDRIIVKFKDAEIPEDEGFLMAQYYAHANNWLVVGAVEIEEEGDELDNILQAVVKSMTVTAQPKKEESK